MEVPDTSVLPNVVSLARECSVTCFIRQNADRNMLDWDFKHITMPRFIAAFDKCPMGSVEDIIKFNETNKDRAMPARKLDLATAGADI